MASKKQTSPVFAENMLYKIWKNKIDIRKLVTSVEAKEQGIFALLDSLDGNAKTEKAVSELTAAELNVENGLNFLLEKLNKVFQEETIDEAYNVYSSFINLSKRDGISINEYIIEFEHLNNRMIQHQMKLPNTVLTLNCWMVQI